MANKKVEVKKLSRKEKIQTLSDLITGKKTIKDLQGPQIYIWHCMDGVHYTGPGGKNLTEDQFNEWKGNGHPESKCLIFRLQKGNDPLPGEDETINPDYLV